MVQIKDLDIKHIKPYIILCSIFWLIGTINYVFPHGSIFLWINQHHTEYFDKFFKFFSYIGDGELFGYLLIGLGIWKFRYAIIGVTGYLSGGIIVQILKRIINEPRPAAYFDNSTVINFVEGVKVHTQMSFPSGHSASAFAIFLFLALIIRSKVLSLIFFFAALSTSVARIYLVQHFFWDIYVGSIIGTVCMLYVYYLWERSDKVTNSKWYNYSLMKSLFNLSSKSS